MSIGKGNEMNRYGDVAVRVVELILNESKSEPLIAWNSTASEMFGKGTWAQKKGCPKNAFLGLCEAGLVKGIMKGNYAERSGLQKNKNYAIQAVLVLRVRPELAEDKLGLWRAVMNGEQMSHNSQMDVVIALWINDLIVSREMGVSSND